ncbi:ATP-binding protein [Streptomyces sp. NPDC056670]|uniref:ATP-binding protein n=1 Tax=Streptomyces sp. NPDC056670 TaxID=3345904 RepID=UPI0036791D52
MAGKIPEETSSFVGRREELLRVERALSAHRLVTLTGTGGVGKTRVALRATARGGPGYRDGVIWAELWPLMGSDLLTATVGQAAGLADHTPRVAADVLCSWLAEREALLVLDSCEHLAADCRRLLGELLRSAPGLTVLATSRQPLEVEGEHVLAIGPLPVDGTGGAGAPGDAVRLLLSRAAEAAPDVDVDSPRERAAAEAICRRLEGIPLALELASGQLRHRRLTDLVEALGSPLTMLSGEPSARPPWHASLRTTIGWSHELCTPAERLLWARLSVLRGPFETRTAQLVCSGGPLNEAGVAEALSGLVAKCVVQRDGDRHRMLDSLNEYGRMWLAELGERERLADRHAAYFHEVVRRADERWLGPEQAGEYQRIAQAHPDLCAALDHLLTGPGRDALDLAGRVAFFWSCCGHLHEARHYLERALVEHREPGPVLTRALWALGIVRLLQGEPEPAAQLAAHCARAAEEDEDPEAGLGAAYLLSLTYLMTGRPLVAQSLAESALSSAADDDFASPSRLRCRLITVFTRTALGVYDEAEVLARRLLGACERRDEVWTRSYVEYQLSLIALFQDRPAEAAEHARAMLRGKRRLGDRFGMALGVDLLAAAAAEQGEGEQAARLSGTGQTYWRSVGHPQRGTPELAAVRERTDLRARTAIGDHAYRVARQRGASDTRTTLALALGPVDPPAPPE